MIKYCGFILILLSGSPLFACDPGFPPAYLNGADFITDPLVHRQAELELIANHFYPELTTANFSKVDTPKEQAIRNDFMMACLTGGINEASAKILYNRMLIGLKSAAAGQYTPLFHPYPQLREFDLYAGGIAEMTLDKNQLPPSWLELLCLPPEQRRYRTAWTLYVLGNMSLNKDWQSATLFYQQLQDYVRNGGYDSQGLAYASFRSEYIYSYEQSDADPTKWIKTLLRWVAMSHNARNLETIGYLRTFFEKKYSHRYKEQKQEMMNDAAVREVVVLFEAAKNNFEFPAEAVALLKDYKLLCADHLAWMAYKSGKYESCLLFMNIIPDNSLIKLWLQAKFARRHGDFKTSAELLRRWLDIFEKEKPQNNLHFITYPFDSDTHAEFAAVVKGELGYTLVSSEDFSEALYTFMKAESWVDGACVAEQLMPLDDLIIFCKNHCPEDKISEFSDKLRHLLARRLLRHYRLDEALKWFPAKHKKLAEEYVKMFRDGNDIKKTRNERAIVFYNLGKHVRYHGPALMATELAPDYYINGCDYDYYSLDEKRNLSNDNDPTSHSSYFDRRQDKLPTMRWHYRYKAVEFWTRAAALTNNDDVRAAALYLAFRTTLPRQTENADYYYKMLCDCRPNPLAQRAWQGKGKLLCDDMLINTELKNPNSVREADFAELFKIYTNDTNIPKTETEEQK